MGRIQPLIDIIDDAVEIRRASYKGWLYWPVIRFQVYQHIINVENGLSDPRRGSRLSKVQLIRGFALSFLRLTRLRKVQNLFLTTSLSLVRTSGGHYFNRISDYFLPLFSGKSAIIEESIDFKHPMPRAHSVPVFSKVVLTVLTQIVVMFQFKLNKKLTADTFKEVDDLLETVSELLRQQNRNEAADSMSALRYNLTKQLLSVRPTAFFYSKLLKNSSVQLIMIEDGHYGAEKSVINYCAHELGIKVYEPQHGFLNQNHPAYYYGNTYVEDETVKPYYPDILFTYGPYWSNVARIPNQTVEIGNPHFERTVQGAAAQKEKLILVIGSGVTVFETNSALKKLLEIAGDYQIMYRPHPQEKDNHLERYMESYSLGVLHDTRPLYESLSRAEIVIAEVSTVLFEAVAFCDFVYLLNTSYTKSCYDEYIRYFRVVDINELKTIFDGDSVDHKSAMQYYWATDWKRKFSGYAN